MNNRTKIYKIFIIILIILVSLFICINAYSISDKFINNRTTITYFNIKPFVSRIDAKGADVSIGDLIFAKDVPITEIQKGDIIVYKQDSYIRAKKVLDIKNDNNKTNFIVNKENGTEINESNSKIEGKIVRKIAKLGYLILFIKTIEGTMLSIALLVCISIIIVLLYSKNEDEPNNKEKTSSSN